MNNATNFALSVQEQSNGKGFVEALEATIREYYDKIDISKSTDDILAFVDNSGCKFDGHKIILIKSMP